MFSHSIGNDSIICSSCLAQITKVLILILVELTHVFDTSAHNENTVEDFSYNEVSIHLVLFSNITCLW